MEQPSGVKSLSLHPILAVTVYMKNINAALSKATTGLTESSAMAAAAAVKVAEAVELADEETVVVEFEDFGVVAGVGVVVAVPGVPVESPDETAAVPEAVLVPLLLESELLELLVELANLILV